MTNPPVDLEKLTAPFPSSAIKQRQGGGGRMLSYVEGHTYIQRLIDATGNCYDFALKDLSYREVGQDKDGNPMLLQTVRAALTIPGHGTREGIGVQLLTARGGEDMEKGGLTDAFKNAAKYFGVGLELYGPDYEAGEVAPRPEQHPSGKVTRMAPTPQPRATTRPQPAAEDDGAPARANPGQVEGIRRMWEKDLGRDEAGLARFLMEQFAQEAPEALTFAEAGKVITTLSKEVAVEKAATA